MSRRRRTPCRRTPITPSRSRHRRTSNPVAATRSPGDARDMPSHTVEPPYDRFLATAEAVVRERPEVDPEMAREVFLEVATMLYNGLALDGLDEHDTAAAV